MRLALAQLNPTVGDVAGGSFAACYRYPENMEAMTMKNRAYLQSALVCVLLVSARSAFPQCCDLEGEPLVADDQESEQLG